MRTSRVRAPNVARPDTLDSGKAKTSKGVRVYVVCMCMCIMSVGAKVGALSDLLNANVYVLRDTTPIQCVQCHRRQMDQSNQSMTRCPVFLSSSRLPPSGCSGRSFRRGTSVENSEEGGVRGEEEEDMLRYMTVRDKERKREGPTALFATLAE